MINTSTLILALAAGAGPLDGLLLDPESDDTAAGYVDWSQVNEDGSVSFEVGEPTAPDGSQLAAVITLTREQLATLQRRLALYLATTE